jgi:hypothetical protein
LKNDGDVPDTLTLEIKPPVESGAEESPMLPSDSLPEIPSSL